MTITRALVITPWGEATDESGSLKRWPLVSSEFPLQACVDITGQAHSDPSPNLFVALVTAEEAVISAITADPRFLTLHSDLGGLLPGSALTSGRFAVVRDWLRAQGLTLTQVRDAVGSTTGERTNGEVAELIRSYLRGLPRR